MKILSKKGFTLIELLVVMSVIGLLSSVVLAALGSAKARGRDSSIRTNLISMRNQMEVDTTRSGEYGANTNYANAAGTNASCGFGNFHSAGMQRLKTNLASYLTSGSNFVCSVNVVSDTQPATRWAVAAILPSGSGLACVDFGGELKVYSGVSSVGAIATSTHLNDGNCI
jgi:prepilin-type N-terminal cleavage/methylation domain-containing protein